MANILLHWPRDHRGWFQTHWAEYSTIDTAIMVSGVYMAGNYFGGELAELAEEIANIPKWNTIYKDAQSSGIYMISAPAAHLNHWADEMIMEVLGSGDAQKDF